VENIMKAKTNDITEETKLIKDANDRLPVDKRNLYMVKGLYRKAIEKVQQDRIWNPEQYMYMNDDEMSELVKNEFDKNVTELTVGTPAEKEKPEDVKAAEDEFATDMAATDTGNVTEPPIDNELGSESSENMSGNTGAEPSGEGDVTDLFNTEEPSGEETSGEELSEEEGDAIDLFNTEEPSEETEADKINKI